MLKQKKYDFKHRVLAGWRWGTRELHKLLEDNSRNIILPMVAGG
jgi:hypothetical protein